MLAHKMIVHPQQNGYAGIITVLSKRLVLYLEMAAFPKLFLFIP
jgi:hypothetical protein